MRIAESVTIARGADEVFAALCDPATWPRWAGAVAAVRRDGSGPLAVGDTFVQTVRLLGRTIEATCTVTAMEPGRLLAYAGAGGPVGSATMTLVPVDGGTRYTQEMAGDPGRLPRFAVAALEQAARVQLTGDLGRLRRLLEDV